MQWEWAEAGAAAARGQTWRTRGDAAWRLVVEGRHADALPLLAGNLRERLAHGDAAGVALERMRLGTLRQGGARLVDVVATGGVGRALDLDAAGTRVAVIDMDEDVRLYATADGRLLLPPEEVFPDLLDATFDASGRHAVLRNRQGDARLFAVDGWRARTPARRMSAIGGSWILGDSARFIARCYERRLELLDATSLGPRLMHAFAPAEAPTRWAAQPGGALLALGHADGSVRLLDTASLRMRQVRPAPSAAVEVLAFSRDGRWLLAAAGGHVYVWDAAGGTGGVLPAPRAIAATRLQADAGDGTVAAFAPHDGLLWRLPDAPDADLRERIAAARPAVAQLALGRALPRNAAAYAPGTGLFASIARDGRLHLWRWSGPGMPAGRAPPLAAEELHFDGHHVAVVDGHVARVIAVRDGREAGPPLVHPQPVSYAAFTPDGRVLVTASGRELHAFDWRTGRLLYPPWPLDGTPLQVRLSPDSAHLLVTTLQRRDGRHVAIASVFDLRGGRVLAHGVALPGPLPGVRFSRDGRRLVHWQADALQVRDAATLQSLGTLLRPFAQAPAGALLAIDDAWVADDGHTVTVSIDSMEEPEAHRLVEMDAASGRVLRERRLEPGFRSRLLDAAGSPGLLLHAQYSGGVYWSDAGHDLRLPFPAATVPPVHAASGDGRWLAVAAGGEVLVGDRASGEWAAVLPASPLPLGDHVVQLAFARDGGALLARTAQGRWVWWPLPDAAEDDDADLAATPTDDGPAGIAAPPARGGAGTPACGRSRAAAGRRRHGHAHRRGGAPATGRGGPGAAGPGPGPHPSAGAGAPARRRVRRGAGRTPAPARRRLRHRRRGVPEHGPGPRRGHRHSCFVGAAAAAAAALCRRAPAADRLLPAAGPSGRTLRLPGAALCRRRPGTRATPRRP